MLHYGLRGSQPGSPVWSDLASPGVSVGRAGLGGGPSEPTGRDTPSTPSMVATRSPKSAIRPPKYLKPSAISRLIPSISARIDIDDMEQLFTRWEEIKAEERAAQDRPARGPLDAVPAALPALRKAREMQSKADKAGLLERAMLAESDPELLGLLPEGSDEERLGRLLWRLVALARTVVGFIPRCLRAHRR